MPVSLLACRALGLLFADVCVSSDTSKEEAEAQASRGGRTGTILTGRHINHSTDPGNAAEMSLYTKMGSLQQYEFEEYPVLWPLWKEHD